jgi:hypothetical protein
MMTKARLAARGFEDHEVKNLQTDSPTCSKETIRIAIALMASKEWSCRTLDVKTAFLQGNPLEREVFLIPPKEAHTENIWKLNKAVYSLNEASRYWYSRVNDELLKLGMARSCYDEALFYWMYKGKCNGILAVHVDDFIFGGTQKFHDNIMEAIRQIFVIGTEESTPLKYLGINIDQDKNTITFNLKDYIKDAEESDISPDRTNRQRQLTSDEQYCYRAVCG